MLEALQVHLFLTTGNDGGDGGESRSVPSAYTSSANVGGGLDEYAGLNALQRKVLLWIKEHKTNDEGVEIQEIAHGVKGEGVNATTLAYDHQLTETSSCF
jgi:hypothetical protein